jgi:hypothetical protein
MIIFLSIGVVLTLMALIILTPIFVFLLFLIQFKKIRAKQIIKKSFRIMKIRFNDLHPYFKVDR